VLLYGQPTNIDRACQNVATVVTLTVTGIIVFGKCFRNIFTAASMCFEKSGTWRIYRSWCYKLNMLKLPYVNLKLKANLIKHLAARRNRTELAGLKWHLFCVLYFGNQILVTTWTVFLNQYCTGGVSEYISVSAVPFWHIAQLEATFIFSEEHDFITREFYRINTLYYKRL